MYMKAYNLFKVTQNTTQQRFVANNESLSYMKSVEFPDQLSNYHFLKKDFAPWP